MRKLFHIIWVGIGLVIIYLIVAYPAQIDKFLGTTGASNYLLIILIGVEGASNFLIYHMEKRDRLEDKKEIHTKELVDNIYVKLITIQAQVTHGKLDLQVERYSRWDASMVHLPEEALWIAIDRLQEPYLEFAMKHLEKYDEIIELLEKAKSFVAKINAENLQTKELGEARLLLTEGTLRSFSNKMIELVNDLRAGVPLKGKCRRGI